MKRCCLCQGYTEYYCHTCKKDLCRHCKAVHVIDLDTQHHEVTIYRQKFKNIHKQDRFVINGDIIYNKYCETCEVPVCNSWSDRKSVGSPLLASTFSRQHKQHKIVGIRKAYQTKRQQHKKCIHDIRSETIYNRRVILNGLKSDVKSYAQTCQTEFTIGHSKMKIRGQMRKKGQKLKDRMDKVIDDVILLMKIEHSCSLQKNRMNQLIGRIQKYEQKFEQSVYRKVEFLRFIKKVCLPQTQDTPELTQHYLLKLKTEIDINQLVELLSDIQITRRGKRILPVRNELLPTMTPSPALQKYFSVTGVDGCYHISCVTPDRVWVNDGNHLILTDTSKGCKLYAMEGSFDSDIGKHTVNRKGELIYINKEENVNVLSNDMETTTTVKHKDDKLIPRSLYYSPSTGDVLIGVRKVQIIDVYMMARTEVAIGKVMRYDNTWQHKQTIPHSYINCTLYSNSLILRENDNGDLLVFGNVRIMNAHIDKLTLYDNAKKLALTIPSDYTPNTLYKHPNFITENNNGDVVVADYDAVKVTTREGGHRFSYLGHSSGRFRPHAICTDALSHILVCDEYAGTIEMLSQDGKFLKYLFSGLPSGIEGPSSLSYDVQTHRLWVGSVRNNKLSMFRHMPRDLTLTGKSYSLFIDFYNKKNYFFL